MKKQLLRTVQCAKCPWKVSTNPHDIPDGYCETKHKGLRDTIAPPGEIFMSGKAMSCHHARPNEKMHCIGWLVNQIGIGNNIGLRMQMLDYDLTKVRTVGEQHERFEDTLPENKPRPTRARLKKRNV